MFSHSLMQQILQQTMENRETRLGALGNDLVPLRLIKRRLFNGNCSQINHTPLYTNKTKIISCDQKIPECFLSLEQFRFVNTQIITTFTDKTVCVTFTLTSWTVCTLAENSIDLLVDFLVNTLDAIFNAIFDAILVNTLDATFVDNVDATLVDTLVMCVTYVNQAVNKIFDDA